MKMSSGDKEEEEEEERRRIFFDFFVSKLPESNTVLDHRMRNLLDMLGENRPFSFDDFGRECLQIHKNERAKVKEILKNVDGKISLSVDVLRSRKADNNDSQYMCLTAHFIDHNWTLTRLVLDFILLGVEGEDPPSEIILRSLRDWEIENKLWTITSVNKSLYNEVFNQLNIHRPALTRRLHLVHCSADMIQNLVVQLAFEDISDFLDKIEDIYSLEDVLPTWKNKFMHYKEAILKNKAGDFAGIPSGNLTKYEWDAVSAICELVQDVYDHVFPLFEKGYQPASVIRRILDEFQRHLRVQDSESNSMYPSKMLEITENYMAEVRYLLTVASAMDPRSKMRDVPDSTYSWFSVFNGKEAKSEMEKYSRELVRSSNPLTWWKDVGSTKYPILSKMARDFLAIPFTVACGDDALIIGQREVEASLSSIQPSMANALMCIRSWLLDKNSALSS